jgi:hypothetical protein
MSRTVELPDEIYRDLERVAREQGLTPAGWIASTLSGGAGATDKRPLSDLLQGLIGVVDSTRETQGGQPHTPFSELITRKFEKQGLRKA